MEENTNALENVVEVEKCDFGTSYDAYPDNGEIIISGTHEERIAMFKDYAEYMGEITNPDNIAINPHLKSKYAPLGEVLNTVRPVLSKHRMAVLQAPSVSDNKVLVRTMIVHADGAAMIFPSLAMPMAKIDAQGIMATLTYARRGSLNATLGMYGEEDDDGNGASGKKPKSDDAGVDEALRAKRAEVAKLCATVTELGGRDDAIEIIKKHCGIRNPNNIKTVEDCDSVIKDVKKWINDHKN